MHESTTAVPGESIAHAVLRAHPDLVVAWRRNEPGAWGALAAHAVLLAQNRIDRRLIDAERRTVWADLWRALTLVAWESDARGE